MVDARAPQAIALLLLLLLLADDGDGQVDAAALLLEGEDHLGGRCGRAPA
jgi:hypothetical protein